MNRKGMSRLELTTKQPVSAGTAHARIRRVALRGGEWRPWVSPEPAMRRLQLLSAAGWSRNALHYATGVSVMGIERIRDDKRIKIRPETSLAILTSSLDPRRLPSEVLISAIGTQRRLGSLMWMQWSYKALSEYTGTHWTSFDRVMQRTRINAGLASIVAKAYDELSDTLGPRVSSGTRARQYGHQPPIVWDIEPIDEPPAPTMPWPRRSS